MDESTIRHIDDNLKRIVDPVIVDVKDLKTTVNGNGKDGLRTRTRVIEQENAIFKEYITKKIDEIERKQDRSYWFLITTMALTILNFILGRL